MKVHKLLYYCQGLHLATFDEPLFVETISAYDHGPVVGTLWFAEKAAGPAPATIELDEASLNTIGYAVSRYGALSGSELERLTHTEPPWVTADSRRTPGTSVRITVESIKDYFRTTEADDDEADGLPDAEAVAELVNGALERLAAPARTDSVEELRARLQISA